MRSARASRWSISTAAGRSTGSNGRARWPTSSASTAPITPTSARAATRAFDGIGDYVSHYELLFPALGLDTFHLAGASMGGHMAARYAAANPGDIDKLVLNLAGRADLRACARCPISARSRRPTCRRCSCPIPRGSCRTGRPIPRPNGRPCATVSSCCRVRLARGPGRDRPRAAPGGSGASTGRRCCCGARPTGSSRSASRRTGRRSCRTPSSSVIPGGFAPAARRVPGSGRSAADLPEGLILHLGKGGTPGGWWRGTLGHSPHLPHHHASHGPRPRSGEEPSVQAPPRLAEGQRREHRRDRHDQARPATVSVSGNSRRRGRTRRCCGC